MFNSLYLKNFQRHKKLKLKFDKNITSICGKSDSGKSSIFRAIRLLCLNRPDGISFVRNGASYSLVELKVDGIKITRKKGKGRNTYAISDIQDGTDNQLRRRTNILQSKRSGEESKGIQSISRRNTIRGQESIFKAFGQEVPHPIQKILQISPLNFQGQHSNPFWFSLTPGQVAKELNGIVNLSVIDETLTTVASELRKTRLEAEVSRNRLQDARQRKEELAWVRQADADLKLVETKGKYLDELTARIAFIASILEEGIRLAERRDNAACEASALATVIRAGTRLRQATEKVDFITDLLNRIRKITESKCQLAKELSETKAELKKASEARCPLCGRETM